MTAAPSAAREPRSPTSAGWSWAPAEPGPGPVQNGQRGILACVVAALADGRSGLLREAIRLATLEAFPVEIRGGVVHLGTVSRPSHDGEGTAAEGRPKQRPISIDLFTDLPDGRATVVPQPSALPLPDGGGSAPVIALESDGGAALFRVTAHVIPVRPAQSRALMDYVHGLMAASAAPAAPARAIPTIAGGLEPKQQQLLLGYATGRHPIRLSIPREIRAALDGTSAPFTVECTLPGAGKSGRGWDARLLVGGIAAYYAITRTGRHLQLRAVSAWPELAEFLLAANEAHRREQAKSAAGDAADLAVRSSADALARSRTTARTTPASLVSMGRVGTHPLAVRLAEIPGDAEVRLHATLESPYPGLVAEWGRARLLLELRVPVLWERAAASVVHAKQDAPVVADELPVIRVSENALRIFERPVQVWDFLRKRLGDPAAGATAELGGVTFQVVRSGNRPCWAFGGDAETLRRVSELVGQRLRSEAHTNRE